MPHVLKGLTLAALLAVVARADTGGATPIEVSLRDGSRLVGTTSVSVLRLHTDAGNLRLPLRGVLRVRMLADRETSLVELRNSDRITGVLDLPHVGVKTAFGDVQVPLAVVLEWRIAPEDPAPGLVLHYDFDQATDGVVVDRSGRGSHGRLRGGARLVPSPSGRALRVSGPDDFLVCESPKFDVTGWRELTVSVWIRMERYTTYNAVLHLGRLDGSKSHGIHLQAGHRHPSFAAPVSLRGKPHQVQTFNEEIARPSLRRWHHLVGTMDRHACRLYLDGGLISTTRRHDGGGDLHASPGLALLVGKTGSHRMRWRDAHLDGRIDELRIWSRALSAAAVRALFAGGRSHGF